MQVGTVNSLDAELQRQTLFSKIVSEKMIGVKYKLNGSRVTVDFSISLEMTTDDLLEYKVPIVDKEKVDTLINSL